jgi:hypothetical protein
MSTSSQINPQADITAVANDYEVTANHTVPAGAIHLSFAVKAGTVRIGNTLAGTSPAIYTAGETLELPPMPDHIYPSYIVTFIVAGNVRINRVGE